MVCWEETTGRKWCEVVDSEVEMRGPCSASFIDIKVTGLHKLFAIRGVIGESSVKL